jgi:hypothetical protein
MIYTDQEKKEIAHPPSDASEIISTEVQTNTPEEASFNKPLNAGYTVDNEGNFNNYAVEPKMYKAEYPSPKQQRRYIFLGAGAILFVTLALWIAFAVS